MSAEALDEVHEVATLDLLREKRAAGPQDASDLLGVVRGVPIEDEVERQIRERQVVPIPTPTTSTPRGARRPRAISMFGA
jgi:methyl coenzyme M reductase subunit C-like uncharacterized protein (methanogenesis marker protein 7)